MFNTWKTETTLLLYPHDDSHSSWHSSIPMMTHTPADTPPSPWSLTLQLTLLHPHDDSHSSWHSSIPMMTHIPADPPPSPWWLTLQLTLLHPHDHSHSSWHSSIPMITHIPACPPGGLPPARTRSRQGPSGRCGLFWSPCSWSGSAWTSAPRLSSARKSWTVGSMGLCSPVKDLQAGNLAVRGMSLTIGVQLLNPQVCALQ